MNALAYQTVLRDPKNMIVSQSLFFWDFVTAFSQGIGLAATLFFHESVVQPQRVFKYVSFFLGIVLYLAMR